MDLKSLVRDIPDFPKKGILFRDITPLIGNADAFEELVETMAKPLREKDIDLIVGPEARGFIFGVALANALHAGFVPARKPGKLPYKTIGYQYGLEYGTTTCWRPAARRLPARSSSKRRAASWRAVCSRSNSAISTVVRF